MIDELKKNIIKGIIKTSFVLFFLKILRLYTNNNLSINNFDKKFFQDLLGTLLAIIASNILIDYIYDIFDDYYKEEFSLNILKIVISILIVTITKIIYSKIVFNKNIINNIYIKGVLLSIFSLTFYKILFEPLFKKTKLSMFLNQFIKDLILYISADFMIDAKLNNIGLELELNSIGSLLGIILNSVLKKF
jgi:hypothetical protein